MGSYPTMLKLNVMLIGFLLSIVNAAKRDPVLQKELDDWVQRGVYLAMMSRQVHLVGLWRFQTTLKS
jgi:hypothetical protein